MSRALASASEFHVVVIAASLGGPDVLQSVLPALPVDFPVPVLVVQHLPEAPRSEIVRLLGRGCAMRVRWPEDGQELRPSTIYVAPAGRHLEVDARGRVALSDAPRVNFARPSADPLFTSAAAVFGPGTLGVVLTGRLHDGAAGALAVRRAGGVVIAQDPATCRAPEMPRHARARGAVHLTLPPDALAAALVCLTAVRGARALFGLPRSAA